MHLCFSASVNAVCAVCARYRTISVGHSIVKWTVDTSTIDIVILPNQYDHYYHAVRLYMCHNKNFPLCNRLLTLSNLNRKSMKFAKLTKSYNISYMTLSVFRVSFPPELQVFPSKFHHCDAKRLPRLAPGRSERWQSPKVNVLMTDFLPPALNGTVKLER